MPIPKLLFDNNLSPTFPAAVADLFPESAHVADIGDLRHGVDDPTLIAYARDNGFGAVVTTDKFREYPEF